MPQNNKMVMLSGVTVVLAIIALAGVVVFRLGPAAVGTLTALATVLATVPQIIKAVQGRTR